MPVAAAQKVGKVVQVIGPVVDVEFEGGHLPEIYNAVHIKSDGKGGQPIDVIVEVEQRNRGRASGVAVDFHYFQVSTVRNRKVTASYMAETRAQALEAAGLSE